MLSYQSEHFILGSFNARIDVREKTGEDSWSDPVSLYSQTI